MSTLTKSQSWQEVPTFVADNPDEELLDVDREVILSQFKEHGVVLFRSFGLGAEKFQAMVRAYSTAQIPYPGSQRIPISVDGKVQTVDAGMKAIPLHSELSHTPFRPDVCWFYCVKAPKSGSETILCDGARVAAELPDQYVQLFEGERLCYRRTTPIAFLERLFGTKDVDELREFLAASPKSQFYTIHGDKVDQYFEAPVLQPAKFRHQPVFANNLLHNYRPGEPLLYPSFSGGLAIPEQIILDIRKIAQKYTFDICWRNEDLLMIDNTRFMHGRRAILDPGRSIWTQFSDVSF